MVNEWAAGALFVLGSLWAIPAWYLGKAAGMAYARRKRRENETGLYRDTTAADSEG